MAKIFLGEFLRKQTQSKDVFEIAGATVKELVGKLKQLVPALDPLIEDGAHGGRYGVFHNDYYVSRFEHASKPVDESDELDIWPKTAC